MFVLNKTQLRDPACNIAEHRRQRRRVRGQNRYILFLLGIFATHSRIRRLTSCRSQPPSATLNRSNLEIQLGVLGQSGRLFAQLRKNLPYLRQIDHGRELRLRQQTRQCRSKRIRAPRQDHPVTKPGKSSGCHQILDISGSRSSK